MIWALLLAGTLVVSAGSALAGGSLIGGVLAFDNGDVVLTDFRAPDSLATGECGAAIGHQDLTAVASELDESVLHESRRDQKVKMDRDNALLGIALASSGARDITWNNLRDYDATFSEEFMHDRDVTFERDDVFSALALGVKAAGGSIDALGCVSDLWVTMRAESKLSRDVDLDRDNVFLAIALAGSGAGHLALNDIASIAESERTQVTRDQQVNIDRDDAFLALALGAGGSRHR